MKDTKMTPRIAETAKGLWFVYVGITIASYWCLLAGGMSWFDAICHAFSTVSLGGFSTHDESFGYFNSPTLEWTCIGFMLFSGINYGTHFLAFRGRTLDLSIQRP